MKEVFNMGSKIPEFNFIKDSFENEGYILLSDHYIDSKHKLSYVCLNGHRHSISWNNWKSGKRCPFCYKMRAGSNLRLSFGFVKESINTTGEVLISEEYINARTKLEILCSSGHLYFMSWDSFRAGHRCPTCQYIKISGSGSPNWKGGIANAPYCSEWTRSYKEEIKERDGYKCLNPDCRNNYKRLHVHHIDYTKGICGPDNLITLCDSCNARANKDREWHTEWYRIILNNRYNYIY